MIILGVDPGTIITGYAVIDFSRSSPVILECDIIKMQGSLPLSERLKCIYDKLTNVIKKYKPDEFVIETAFYSKNIQSTLKLGQARGVSILAAAKNELNIIEYSPREIKKSIVGHGNASKEQIRYMVGKMLNYRSDSKHMDYTDALAIALCHKSKILYNSHNKRSSKWSDYVLTNPGKVKRSQ